MLDLAKKNKKTDTKLYQETIQLPDHLLKSTRPKISKKKNQGHGYRTMKSEINKTGEPHFRHL